jgi:hypothetical protein
MSLKKATLIEKIDPFAQAGIHKNPRLQSSNFSPRPQG